MTGETIIEAKALSRRFAIRGKAFGRKNSFLAVNDIDLRIARGEILGIVGESGCGKSTLGRLMLGLLAPSEGRVVFDGRDLSDRRGAEQRRTRRRLQMVFQDPYGSLDPRRSVGPQIADGLRAHAIVTPGDVGARVDELLDAVGLERGFALRRPHEFSGGQRQRVAIARALATRPDFIVADEPVSALDVSVQAQIINLLRELGSNLNLAMMFISHDLHLIRHLSARTAVMYLGRIVEEGPTEQLFREPAHPYTRTLLQATPSMQRGWLQASSVRSGEPPALAAVDGGCAFRNRCPIAGQRCDGVVPRLATLTPSRKVACIRENPASAAAAADQ